MRIRLKRSLTCLLVGFAICSLTLLLQTHTYSSQNSMSIQSNEEDVEVRQHRLRQRQRVLQTNLLPDSNASRSLFPLRSRASILRWEQPVEALHPAAQHSLFSTSSAARTTTSSQSPNASSRAIGQSARPYPPLNASGTAPGTPIWLTNIFARLTGLGNRLFNTASLYGLARTSGTHVPLLFHDDWLPCQLFGNRAGVCCTQVCSCTSHSLNRILFSLI